MHSNIILRIYLKVRKNMEIVDFLITFFLGVFGIHRFMKKYTIMGSMISYPMNKYIGI